MQRFVLWLGLAVYAILTQPVAGAAMAEKEEIAQIIYDRGLQGGWQDWGWAKRTLETGKPARLHMNKYAGWILARRGITGRFSTLRFDLQAPPDFGNFFEVRLSGDDDSLPHVPVALAAAEELPNGWRRVRVSMKDLNPSNAPFDRIIFRATKSVGDDEVAWDKVLLIGGGAAPPPLDPSSLSSHPANLSVDCRAPTRPISSYIYGIAYSPRRDGQDTYQWRLGATARRWGGNPASRYNWQLGNAWNTGFDWFYSNVNYSNDPSYTWKKFLQEDVEHHVGTALTVPMLGWVAKDTVSYSFPVAEYGNQQYANGDKGNGKRKGGGFVSSDPLRTSLAAPASFVGAWIQAIRKYDAATGVRSVQQYILDNEPALWNSTHRDVHPAALTYDELLQRTQEFATAVRHADPDAVIAGPAEWGWPGYFYSARDAEVGFSAKPDRREHGDVPLVDWYLRKLRDHEKKTGERLLDVLDFHFYPQANGIYGHHERNDPVGAERRIRSTRGLWDPTYQDESWINDKIQLLPRMHDLIAANYPGLKISIGEYNFGGEHHISGGLAQAETLGRFGQYGVYSAYYWTYPPDNSPSYQAFRAFRNYDGDGGHFLENSVVARSDGKTSLFVSQNQRKDLVVAVLLNLDATEVANAHLELAGCGAIGSSRAFSYAEGSAGLSARTKDVRQEATTVELKLMPYSINVLELKIKR